MVDSLDKIDNEIKFLKVREELLKTKIELAELQEEKKHDTKFITFLFILGCLEFIAICILLSTLSRLTGSTI